MYAGELQKIAVVMRQFYGCEEMPGPARPDSMERLLRQAKKELQKDLPQASGRPERSSLHALHFSEAG